LPVLYIGYCFISRKMSVYRKIACFNNRGAGYIQRNINLKTSKHSDRGLLKLYQFNYVYSLNIGVDKYLSPVSGKRATIVLPLFSGRLANKIAA